jgi:hypothetical protein
MSHSSSILLLSAIRSAQFAKGQAMKETQFRILEGYGDPTNPGECWSIGWVTNPDDSDMVFTSQDVAVEYSQNYYDADLFNRPSWKSFWTYVTDAETIDEAMNEWDMKS